MLERILAALALRLARPCPVHAGPAGREDYAVMFARARRRRPPADDFEEEDYAPRPRGPRALRRFDGIGSRGSKSDMPKIIGISVAVIVLLVVLALLLFLLGSKNTPLIDRDEPRFARDRNHPGAA